MLKTSSITLYCMRFLEKGDWTQHKANPLLRLLKNVLFCPIPACRSAGRYASGLNFNPRNTQCIPVVEIFAFLDLEQNWTFFKGLLLYTIHGAEGGTRTPTGLRPLDPEPSASTSSATSASNRVEVFKIKIYITPQSLSISFSDPVRYALLNKWYSFSHDCYL